MKPYLDITDSGLASLKAFAESNGNSIVMVNLMQVRPNAAYEAPLAGNCTGYEALARYTNESATVRQAAGAELVWPGFSNAYWPQRESLGLSGPSKIPERKRISDDDSNQSVRGCSQAQNCRSFRL